MAATCTLTPITARCGRSAGHGLLHPALEVVWMQAVEQQQPLDPLVDREALEQHAAVAGLRR